MEASEMGTKMVVNTLARIQANGGQPPTFAELQDSSGLGREELVDVVAALKTDDHATQDDEGRILLTDEALAAVPAEVTAAPQADAPLPPEAVEEFLDAAAEKEAEELLDAPRPAGTGEGTATVQLTPGMVGSLDESALGGLVKAGLTDAQQSGKARLVVVIE